MELVENLVIANRFRLVRMIGRGGMGSVWRAFDQNLSTDCAIKFIEGEIANLAEAHARFKREAQAAAQLRSPNIVQIFDHNIWEGMPYLAMELLDGEDLGHRLAARVTLSPGEVNGIIAQVCRALGKAHEKGIVHRDLKPDNIFLVTDDDREIAKVVDFGIAKLQANPMDLGGGTKTGSLLGTPYYMSPEQAQGTKSVDSRSDLWALAVIVFQCFTGRLPFESEALGDLLVKIIVAPIPVPSTINPNVPRGFDAWFARAASREPENRYQTAKAFAESLSLALGFTAGVASIRAEMGSVPASLESGGFPTQQIGSQSHPLSNPGDQGTLAGGHAALISSPASLGSLASPAPMGATFSGTLVPAGVPRKGSGVLIAAALGVLVVVGGGIGAVVALKGRAAAPVVLVPSADMVATQASARPTALISPTPADSATTTAGLSLGTGGTGGTGTSGALGASASAATPAPSAAPSSKPAMVAAVGGGTQAVHKNGGVGSVGAHPKPAASATPNSTPPSSTPAGPSKPDLGF